jgi:hypothetical protein
MTQDEALTAVIAKYQERIEALEAQLERQGRLVDWYQEQHPEQLAVIETMQAALREILQCGDEGGPCCHDCADAARAALREDRNAETV